MKKSYKLEDLDCANCAAKMENAINTIEGVDRATVNFMTQKLTLEADEALIPTLIQTIQKVCKKIEPDCTIVVD